MGCYKFEMIADDRFGETEQDLLKRHCKIIDKFSYFPNVSLSYSNVKKLYFPDEENKREHTIQWRITYVMCKNGRVKPTWNTLFGLVNSVKPTPFDRI